MTPSSLYPYFFCLLENDSLQLDLNMIALGSLKTVTSLKYILFSWLKLLFRTTKKFIVVLFNIGSSIVALDLSIQDKDSIEARKSLFRFYNPVVLSTSWQVLLNRFWDWIYKSFGQLFAIFYWVLLVEHVFFFYHFLGKEFWYQNEHLLIPWYCFDLKLEKYSLN